MGGGLRTPPRRARRGAAGGGGAAGLLAAALGEEVVPVVAGAGERGALLSGAGVPGAWGLLLGEALLGLPAEALPRCVVLPRLDPRWSFEDLVHRPLAALPAGALVVVGSPLGAALLRRARPDLRPVAAGTLPVPEETPVLAEGPYDGGPGGHPLDIGRFLPSPGTGLAVLLPPAGEEAPGAVRGIEDGEAATALRIERAFLRGVGELPPGASLAAFARRKVSVLFGLRAVLFPAEGEPRVLEVDIPIENASRFARSFGEHLAGG